MEVSQFQPTKGVRMRDDKISRCYRISRTRNVLINAHAAIGELGTLPKDLMHISRALFREYEIIGELIALLQAAQQPANKKAGAPGAADKEAPQMTTKPKTRKAPGATGINPKMAALAAKLASEYARVREMHAADDGSHDADNARSKIYHKISNLGDKLANVAATNLEEMRLKARYTATDVVDDIEDPISKSMILDILAIGGEVSASQELEENQHA